jgi:hypothetical protein
MTAHLTSHRIALVAAGGLFTALALGGVAQAITDTVFKYSTAQTGYLTIDAVAMAPMNTAAAANYINHPGGPLENFSNDLSCFGTGVNLPQGATITALIPGCRTREHLLRAFLPISIVERSGRNF